MIIRTKNVHELNLVTEIGSFPGHFCTGVHELLYANYCMININNKQFTTTDYLTVGSVIVVIVSHSIFQFNLAVVEFALEVRH